jgi:putative copper resistance protein D
VLTGSSITALGAVLALCALRPRVSRVILMASAAAVAALGLGLALPPLAIDAYPTTYVRPPIPYDVASIASGTRLFRQHCAACHGGESAADGSDAQGPPRPRADLLAPIRAHTAGDVFWWTTTGYPRNGMPAFGDRLSEEERWDLVNFLRALRVSRGARTLPPRLGGERAWLMAPDFVFGVGPMQRTLQEYRGQRTVLLVLYTLPGSQARLAGLAAGHNTLNRFGLEVVAVPTDASPDAVRRLGAAVPILYPVVTDGAADIVTAYRQFTDAPHTEFLIDGQGYIRTRWASNGPGPDVEQLLVDARRLAAESAIRVTPAAH